MTTEVDKLVELNYAIANAESDGDRTFFEALLAPQFAMRRAREKDAYTGRDEFLAGVDGGAARRTEILEIIYVPDNRAVVTCVVDMRTADGGWDRFSNLRVFVRDTPGASWHLLSWANERMPKREIEPATPLAPPSP